ncbi:hypothetical protein B0H14DRAFT_2583298 [Mycena olivaceomarginata]|nr:hypothetical protein B0H14DRAFT_2583298 [Mycena olivaceomarginata]
MAHGLVAALVLPVVFFAITRRLNSVSQARYTRVQAPRMIASPAASLAADLDAASQRVQHMLSAARPTPASEPTTDYSFRVAHCVQIQAIRTLRVSSTASGAVTISAPVSTKYNVLSTGATVRSRDFGACAAALATSAVLPRFFLFEERPPCQEQPGRLAFRKNLQHLPL